MKEKEYEEKERETDKYLETEIRREKLREKKNKEKERARQMILSAALARYYSLDKLLSHVRLVKIRGIPLISINLISRLILTRYMI